MDEFKTKTHDKFFGKLKKALEKFDERLNQQLHHDIKQYIHQTVADQLKDMREYVSSQVRCKLTEM